ncbi:hypothetical protein HDV00_000081 [Rhizophlyctis rosea]|nr:hypothetical protein HDV00_000081 [Rhizophlyctis rosea]
MDPSHAGSSSSAEMDAMARQLGLLDTPKLDEASLFPTNPQDTSFLNPDYPAAQQNVESFAQLLQPVPPVQPQPPQSAPPVHGMPAYRPASGYAHHFPVPPPTAPVDMNYPAYENPIQYPYHWYLNEQGGQQPPTWASHGGMAGVQASPGIPTIPPQIGQQAPPSAAYLTGDLQQNHAAADRRTSSASRFHPYSRTTSQHTLESPEPFTPQSDISASAGSTLIGSDASRRGSNSTQLSGSTGGDTGGADTPSTAHASDLWEREISSKLATGGVCLDPVSMAAAPAVAAVVQQFLNYQNSPPPRPLSLFDDLPPLPEDYVIANLLHLYFEKMSPTISIVHELAFYRSASKPVPDDPTTSMRPPYMYQTPKTGLSPVLLYSMLACAARHHPTYKNDTNLITRMFYERARRLMLPLLEKPTLSHLKALIHLTLFSLEQSLWMASYMWLGNSVTMLRFLGYFKESPPSLAPHNSDSDEKLNGLTVQQIENEEARRCWWWVRSHDASGAAASKRPPMINDEEFATTLLLPCPDSQFYATRFGAPADYDVTNGAGVVPRTQTLDEFMSPMSSSAHAHATIGPNGYLCALVSLFNRVTAFRQHCAKLNILPFAPARGDEDVGEVVTKEYKSVESELKMWYDKLPEWVKVLDRSAGGSEGDAREVAGDAVVGTGLCWQDQWIRETYEWGMNLVIWHATQATLQGPDYNMMTMGSQIASNLRSLGGKGDAPGPKRAAPPHITAAFMSTSRLEEVLTEWQNSDSFNKALDHAAKGAKMLEEMSKRVPLEKRRDTPFFGYCVCQLGLLNLIAARQLSIKALPSSTTLITHTTTTTTTMTATAAEPKAQRTTTTQKQQVTIQQITPQNLHTLTIPSLEILKTQSNLFSASATGLKLLEKVMTEIAGGEITMKILEGMRKQGRGVGKNSERVAAELVRRGTGEGVGEGLDRPGECAGTMVMGGTGHAGRK